MRILRPKAEAAANKIKLPTRTGVYLRLIAVIVGSIGYFAWSAHADRGLPWWPEAIHDGLHFGVMIALFFLVFLPRAFLFPVLAWLFRPAYLWLDRRAPDVVRLSVVWVIAIAAFAFVLGLLAMGGHALLIKLGWV